MESNIRKELRRVERDTISMWNCAEHCRMPPSHSIASFGVDSIEHVKAIKWKMDNGSVTPNMLESVKKNGEKITKLIVTDDNPHKVVFQTIWDMM